MKENAFFRLCVCTLLIIILTGGIAEAAVLSPGTDFYYLDQANVLDEAIEGEIYFSNRLLDNVCGAQIVVITVDSTGTQAIDDYANTLFNQWGIGSAEYNNGFLLLLAIDDDDYYALCGSGLQPLFSSSTIRSYYDQYLEKDFAAGQYSEGVRKMFEAVFARVADAYDANVTVQQGISAYEEHVATAGSGSNYGEPIHNNSLYSQDILFRDIPWGVNYNWFDQEYKDMDFNDCRGGKYWRNWSIDEIITGIQADNYEYNYINMSAHTHNNIEVAGYKTTEINAFFAYLPVDGILTHDYNDTAFYAGQYVIEPVDISAVEADLTSKLSGIYGDVDWTNTYKDTFDDITLKAWFGSNNTAVILTSKRYDGSISVLHDRIMITYTTLDGDQWLKEANDAERNKELKEEQSAAESGNTDGL